MTCRMSFWATFVVPLSLCAAPVIDPVASVTIPARKSLILPVTATSPNNRPLTYTVTSSTNAIQVEVPANNPFWKMSVVQAAASNAPGAYLTPYRGGLVSVTNVGDMTFMLFRDRAPHTVDVIQGLTDSGFYSSNTIFHRVIAGFMNQGGDPGTNGAGGPVFRYSDEYNSKALFTGNGQLALANSGKDTDGSQFFITVAPYRFGDFGYTIFGQLLRGYNVLSNINKTATDANSRPLADVIITKASRVPNTTDTVLPLTAGTTAGTAGTISIVADDGAGGRTTNSFTATIAADTANDPPFINTQSVTNLIGAMNGRLTNFISATDLEGDTGSWAVQPGDANYSLVASNSLFYIVNGQLEAIIIPTAGYAGSVKVLVGVATNASFLRYDSQVFTFAIGDTAIAAAASNFTATAGVPFASQLVATFTNGVATSPTNSFAAVVNWGDNTVDLAVIGTNTGGWKEVRGSHTYTNAGTYPVYVTIQGALGASSIVVATAAVPPAINITASGTGTVLRWPAWAAADYQLQSATNPVAGAWSAATNLPALSSYESVATNNATGGSAVFRLKR
jgi:cyclophilin family peptidyl-prolyl cis-trans isomerase